MTGETMIRLRGVSKSFGAIEGAKQHLARLDAYLQNMQ